MSELYAFRSGPTYRGATPQEQYEAALSQPMSLASTFFDQAKGGVLESFGLGTAIRDITTPEGAKPAPTGDAYTDTITKIDEAISPRNLAKRIIGTFDNDQPPMSKDAYEASEYARDGVPWDASMTEDRAASLAMAYDAKRVREFYAEKRPITSFVANLAGQATDPINYIPIAGPAVRAAAVARTGRVAGLAATASLDAAANTAIFGLGTASQRRQFGDDVSWQATVSQIATAALIGGAFGTIAGALGSRADATSRMAIEERLSTLKTTQEARIALNEGIDALVRAEDVALSPNATEAVARVQQEIIAYHASPNKFDAFSPSEFRGATFFAGSPNRAKTGAAAGQNEYIMETATEPRRGPMHTYEVGINPAEIAGLHYTPKEIDWFNSLPEVINGDDALARAVEGTKPKGFQGVWDDLYDFEEGPDGVYTYTKKSSPPSISYEDAIKTGRDVYGRQHSHYSPQGDEAMTASRVKDKGMKGWLVQDEAGLSIAVADPSSVKIKTLDGQPVDTSPPRPEPIPEGRKQAESRIAKPDDYKALAAQYRVDPETGSFAEEADITHLGIEGRLTEEDLAVLADSQNAFDDGVSYGEALKSVASCLV